MATNNLSPELLARIQAYYAQPTSGSGWSPNMATPYSEGGQVYQQDGGFINAYDPNRQEAGKDQFGVYNPDGTFSNQGTFKTDDAMQTFLMMLAAAGGMQFLPGGAFGGGGGTAGGAAGSGGPGSFLGEGAMSGVPSWDAAALTNGVGSVAGDAYLPGMLGVDGAGMSTAPLGGMFNPALAGGAAASGGAAGAAGSAAGTAAGGAGAAGAAGAAGSLGSLLGPAATLLGAAAGAKGQDASQTSVKSMDPRMDKLFYEDLAPRVQGLLAKQMAPGAMQGFTDMQNVGRNLLNQPVAGNGFNRFFPGR